jgi:hypothetical protein
MCERLKHPNNRRNRGASDRTKNARRYTKNADTGGDEDDEGNEIESAPNRGADAV